jgi:hypothetical protein
MVASPLSLSNLNGSNGFVINGINSGDFSGFSVSGSADINGDGIDDLIIGTYGANSNSNSYAGQSYVVFGSTSGFTASLDLLNLDGSNGFVINGINSYDFSGTSVSRAGDVNGDGINDLIIGAPNADSNGESYAGESYVVFGRRTGFAASLDLSSLNGSNGFIINGINTGDFSGISVSSAGDVNGDGIDDLIIGADGAAPNGSINAGQSYVVFGSATGFDASFDLSTLNGSNGFIINGINPFDTSGISVSTAGDVNNDGIDDLIIGADGAAPNGNINAGESYVVFGSTSGFAPSLELSTLNGITGFIIKGTDSSNASGISVSNAGDINGDGIDDVLIGATNALPNSQIVPGESYVVFGSTSGFAASISLSSLNGSNGFIIKGINNNDRLGFSVSGAGDFNGDGIDDLVIGAYGADPNGNSYAGQSYVVFGSAAGFAGELELSSLDGSNGLIIDGINSNDRSGFAVSSAGDINSDGFDDVIVGAPGATANGNSYAGQSYVIFGFGDNTEPIVNPINGTRNNNNINGTPNNDLISGDNGDDTISGSTGDDTISGGRGGDIINGGAGNDVLAADRVNRFDDFDGTISELRGNSGNDTIFGGSKNDLIDGGRDHDVLFGQNGNDTIRGGRGNDLLNGGIGNDTLIGGTGIDSADYSDLSFNGVFGTIAGLDVNLAQNQAQHSSTNNALTWNDTLISIENVIGTNRNDRFIGDGKDNVFDGQGEVNRNDRPTTFTGLNGDVYQVIADVVEYNGNQSDFVLSGSADNFTVTGSGIGTDTLLNIEFLKFDDGVVVVNDSLFA